MKYHLLNIVRGGLPVVGAVTGGLAISKTKPGLVWVAGGSLAGWVAGYFTRNVLLGMFNAREQMPINAYVAPPELRQVPADVPKVPNFVDRSEENISNVVDITEKKKRFNPDGMGKA